MAYKRVVNGLGAIERFCCLIIKVNTRYGKTIASQATSGEASTLTALLVAAKAFCDARYQEQA